MKKHLTILGCFLFLQWANAQIPTGIVKGFVVDQDNRPVEHANISIQESGEQITTDSNGFFEIQTSSGLKTIVASSAGFMRTKSPVNVQVNEVTEANIQLILKTYNLAPVVVSSNARLLDNSVLAARQQHARIAGGTNVVDLSTLTAQRLSTLKDALQMQPGVIIQEFFGGNDHPRLNIRGSGIQSNPQRRGVTLLQDGIPTNLADGSYILGLLEPRSASYIEVFRGANALRYGASSLGGAINIVSKTGAQASPFEIRAEAGSFGYIGTTISSGSQNGNIDIYTSVSYDEADGYREFNTSSRLNALANILWKVDENLETGLYVTYTDLASDVPGPLTRAQMKQDPKQLNPGMNPPVSIGPNVLRDLPRRDTQVFRVANKTIYDLSKSSRITGSLYYQNTDDVFIFPVSTGVRTSLHHDLGLSIELDVQSAENALLIGVQANTGSIERRYYANVKGVAGKKFADNDLTATNLVFYAEDIYQFTPALSGIVSVQVSQNSRENDDVFESPDSRPFFNFANKSYGVFSSPDTSSDLDYTGFSPKVGLIYELEEYGQVFLNLSRSYEPPTFDELFVLSGGNPNVGARSVRSIELEEQTATTFEMGVRGSNDRISWDVTAYRSWVKNEILTTTDLFGIAGITRNSPDTTIHQGIELGLGITIMENLFSEEADSLDFNLVYNYSDFYFDEGIYNGKQLAGIPKYHISAALEYKHPIGFFANLNLEWLPEDAPTDHQNTVYQDSYHLLGFRLGYNMEHWSFFVEGKNITDENYASSYLIRDVVIDPPPPVLSQKEVTTFLPGTGINFIFGISYSL